MSNSTLPNLFVIGAMKSGTTSLHHYLDIHPQIFMSKVKELNFFIEEENYFQGIDWYKKNFDIRYRYNGESSQNYTKRHIYQGVPERIKELIGNDARFIYVVRDPIKRLVSHINEAKYLGNRSNNFDLEDYSDMQLEKLNYLLTSKYYYQIVPYMNLFPKENFHFVCFEGLLTSPEKELNEIFRFLNLEEMGDEAFLNLKAKNVSKEKKVDSRWLRNLKGGSFVPSFFRKAFPSNFKNDIYTFIEKNDVGKKSIRQIDLSPDLILRIESILKEDIKKFKEWSL